MNRLLLVALLLTGCSAVGVQADDVCTEAQGAYEEAVSNAADTNAMAGAVGPEDVGDLRTMATEGEWVAPGVEARLLAERRAERERAELRAVQRDHVLRAATIVEQNPDCFSVEVRADAADALRKLEQ